MSYKIAVNMIRQFCFCPRIFYYETVMSIKTVKPVWVDFGGKYHKKEQQLSKRRKFDRIIKKDYILYKEYFMSSENLFLTGKADLLLEAEDEVVPVEIKSQNGTPSTGQVLQLAAYGLLAEEKFNKKCHKGLFLFDSNEKYHTVSLNNDIENKLLLTLEKMQNVIKTELLPETPATIFQCNQCEYLNFCNDRNFV